MSSFTPQRHCLAHHLPEDQESPVGPVCHCCKRRLYTRPPCGNFRGFWESQPEAYTLDKKPGFVYRRAWDDFTIRSLRLHDAENNLEGELLSVEEFSKWMSTAFPACLPDSKSPPHFLSISNSRWPRKRGNR